MNRRFFRERVPRLGALALGAALMVGGMPPARASAQVPPLILEMLQNLGSMQEIHEGVALGDYERVTAAGRELSARATRLKGADIATFKIDPARDAQFDGFLAAQLEAARGVEDAGKARDARGVVLAVESMYRNACLSCHATFREPASMLRPATLFMTNFLVAQREIHRGLSTRDHSLVARQARELEAMARVLAWDQVIESTFVISDPAARAEFRGFLNRLGLAANQLERAASDEDPSAQLEAWRAMWQDGCVACHERFRPEAALKSH
jgi:cytochrome c556